MLSDRQDRRRPPAIHRCEPELEPIFFFGCRKGCLDLFGLMDIKERASAILGRRADIMTRDSIHRKLRARIEQSAVPVFPKPMVSLRLRAAVRNS